MQIIVGAGGERGGEEEGSQRMCPSDVHNASHISQTVYVRGLWEFSKMVACATGAWVRREGKGGRCTRIGSAGVMCRRCSLLGP